MFHPDFVTELNKVMTFSSTNKKKRKTLFELFVHWLQTTSTRYNHVHKTFFRIDIGNMSVEDAKKMFLEYYDALFEKNVTVAKFSGKPFSNGQHTQVIVGFTTNELDPKKRSAAVFDDGTVCSIGMIYPIINNS